MVGETTGLSDGSSDAATSFNIETGGIRMNSAYRVSRRTGLPVSACLALLLVAPGAPALDGWGHAFPLTVSNPGGELADYQVSFVLDGDNFDFALAEADGADLRVTEADRETLVPHWIETWDPVAERAVVWVRVAGVAAGGTRDLVLHVGNPAAADASDGAATFLFYSSFEELAGAGGMNAPAPLVTPTYDGSGQVVHPDVVVVPGGWNGYEYWMGMTPYPNSNNDYENPSILVSHDNLTWVVPPGLTNPLVPMPPGHNDDTDLLLVGGELILYYNETNSNGTTYLTRLSSTDGVNWSEPQAVIVVPNYIMSPTVIFDEGVYKMWYVHSPGGCTSPYQDFYLRTSTDGISWGPEQDATLDHPGRVLWHLDVQRDGDRYVMVFISYPDGSNCGDTQLYYAESADGLVWTAEPSPLLTPVSSHWDSGNIYRASFTIADTWLRIWYSAMSTSGQWRVGYTEGDLDDFLIEPVSTWDELRGNVAATTDHPRTGTHGLRQIGGSTYPQVFAGLPGDGVCINVWYWEALSAATDFMALLRLWDSDNSVYPFHCIGTGVWTGSSTTHYSHHTEGFIYTPSAVSRAAGWRHLSIAAAGGTSELRIDGAAIATLDVLDPALINRFSVEGYRGGTGYFDDAYVRRYVAAEPTVTVGPELVGVGEPAPALAVQLAQNVPNPLNPGTVIGYDLPRAGAVRLGVYDLQGRLVRTLVAGTREAGHHEARWDGRDERGAAVATGVYLYRLAAGDQVIQRKLTLVK